MADLASVSLPEGSYVVLAKTGLYNLSGAAASVDCRIWQSTASNVLDGTVAAMGVPSTEAGYAAISLQAATVVGVGGGAVTFRCYSSPGMRFYFTHLTAIQVGTLSVP